MIESVPTQHLGRALRRRLGLCARRVEAGEAAALGPFEGERDDQHDERQAGQRLGLQLAAQAGRDRRRRQRAAAVDAAKTPIAAKVSADQK